MKCLLNSKIDSKPTGEEKKICGERGEDNEYSLEAMEKIPGGWIDIYAEILSPNESFQFYRLDLCVCGVWCPFLVVCVCLCVSVLAKPSNQSKFTQQ